MRVHGKITSPQMMCGLEQEYRGWEKANVTPAKTTRPGEEPQSHGENVLSRARYKKPRCATLKKRENLVAEEFQTQ